MTITTTASTFWKNRSFAEHVLQEISSTCVDIKPIGIVSGDRGQPRISLCAKSGEWWLANKAIVILCVHMYRHNTIDNGVRSLKACPEDAQYGALYTLEKHLHKNFEVKEGEGICSKGGLEGGGHLFKGRFRGGRAFVQRGV